MVRRVISDHSKTQLSRGIIHGSAFYFSGLIRFMYFHCGWLNKVGRLVPELVIHYGVKDLIMIGNHDRYIDSSDDGC